MLAMNSRYQGLPIAVYQPPAADGELPSPVPYLTRRFLPAVATLTPAGTHRVGEDDRLDRIAAAEFGDPEAFWRVADANLVLIPADLTATEGRLLLIALGPLAGGSGGR